MPCVTPAARDRRSQRPRRRRAVAPPARGQLPPHGRHRERVHERGARQVLAHHRQQLQHPPPRRGLHQRQPGHRGDRDPRGRERLAQGARVGGVGAVQHRDLVHGVALVEGRDHLAGHLARLAGAVRGEDHAHVVGGRGGDGLHQPAARLPQRGEERLSVEGARPRGDQVQAPQLRHPGRVAARDLGRGSEQVLLVVEAGDQPAPDAVEAHHLAQVGAGQVAGRLLAAHQPGPAQACEEPPQGAAVAGQVVDAVEGRARLGRHALGQVVADRPGQRAPAGRGERRGPHQLRQPRQRLEANRGEGRALGQAAPQLQRRQVRRADHRDRGERVHRAARRDAVQQRLGGRIRVGHPRHANLAGGHPEPLD